MVVIWLFPGYDRINSDLNQWDYRPEGWLGTQLKRCCFSLFEPYILRYSETKLGKLMCAILLGRLAWWQYSSWWHVDLSADSVVAVRWQITVWPSSCPFQTWHCLLGVSLTYFPILSCETIQAVLVFGRQLRHARTLVTFSILWGWSCHMLKHTFLVCSSKHALLGTKPVHAIYNNQPIKYALTQRPNCTIPPAPLNLAVRLTLAAL